MDSYVTALKGVKDVEGLAVITIVHPDDKWFVVPDDRSHTLLMRYVKHPIRRIAVLGDHRAVSEFCGAI
jgi:hypothetical protein